jgi:hypothetical protein
LLDNTIRKIKIIGGYMSKKKKNKVKKLTDEQYNQYVMALKDEKPPLLQREMQGENSVKTQN